MNSVHKLERHICQKLLELSQIQVKQTVWNKIIKDEILVEKLKAMGFNCKSVGKYISNETFKKFYTFLYETSELVDFADGYKIKKNICDFKWVKKYIEDIYFSYVQKFIE